MVVVNFFCSFELLLTNAYVLYKKYHLMHKSTPMSHFKFQRAIAMAWIRPKDFWTHAIPMEAQVTRSSTRSVISMSTRSQGKPKAIFKRGTPFTDKTLVPTGALSGRLNETVHHWPLANKKRYAHCQLHNWATKRRMKKMCCTVLFATWSCVTNASHLSIQLVT